MIKLLEEAVKLGATNLTLEVRALKPSSTGLIPKVRYGTCRNQAILLSAR